MADSSFDPLGMVKAMGPQRDPYSWAELYAADAAKAQMTRDEFKNRLLIQEMTRAERAKEGAADRELRSRLAGEAERGRNRRFDIREKYGFGSSGASGEPMPWPKGSLTEKLFGMRSFRDPRLLETHTLVTKGGHKMYVPNVELPNLKMPSRGAAASAAVNPAASAARPRAPAHEDDDLEDY